MEGGTIEQRRLDGARLIALYGEHDLSTAPRLRRELENALIGASALVVDLSSAEYIDSTVLGLLVRVAADAAQLQVRFAMVAPPGCAARRLVDLVGLGQTIAIYATRSEAWGDRSLRRRWTLAATAEPAAKTTIP